MTQSTSDPTYNSLCTLRSRDNRLLLRARHKRVAHATATRGCHERLTKERRDAVLMHQAWDELAQAAPRIASALELYHFEGLSTYGVATALGRSLKSGVFYLRAGQLFLERSLRRAAVVPPVEK